MMNPFSRPRRRRIERRSLVKHSNPNILLIGILLFGCCFLYISNAYTPNQSSSSNRKSPRPPFIRKQDMIGVWRLTHPKLLLPTNAATKKADPKSSPDDDNDVDNTQDTTENDIVLRLNDDGSFDHYATTEDKNKDDKCTSVKETLHGYNLKGILSRGGCWTFRDGSLILAPDRPDNTGLGTKVHDTLLAGRLNVQVSECMTTNDPSLPMAEVDSTTTTTNDKDSETSSEENPASSDIPSQPEIDVHLSIPSGNVKMGKFMYPRRHKAFFDEPMLFPESSIGTFAMKQLLGNLNARLKQQKEEEANKKPPKFDKSQFYDRKFLLTATPHAVNPSLAAQDKHYHEDMVKYDVRVMPITFHSNNTFTAIGTEKILRGRFGITGDEGHKLWFQVNLFGFGRSAPGSVYSEGRLLSHDDKRGYLGIIQEYQGGMKNQTMFFVDGEFYYGTDLKRTNKAHSWGTFSLQEVDSEDKQEELDEDDDDDDDEKLENLFLASENIINESPMNDDNVEDAFQ